MAERTNLEEYALERFDAQVAQLARHFQSWIRHKDGVEDLFLALFSGIGDLCIAFGALSREDQAFFGEEVMDDYQAIAKVYLEWSEETEEEGIDRILEFLVTTALIDVELEIFNGHVLRQSAGMHKALQEAIVDEERAEAILARLKGGAIATGDEEMSR
jgi:hypothetical protein